MMVATDVWSPSLTGQCALVTGAASGIGRAVAQAFALAGAAVACADINLDGAQATAAGLMSGGASAIVLGVDVSSRASVQAAVDETVTRLGDLTVLCNCAGIIREHLPSEMPDEDLHAVWGVNFLGTLYMCQAAVRHMRTSQRGSIVNTASTAADVIALPTLAYTVSKAAVVQLTRLLATECAAEGIRVNAVAPGYTETAMTERHLADPEDPGERKALLARMAAGTPMGRVGQPEEVAASALFLASPMSSYMTGQVIRPSGGIAMS